MNAADISFMQTDLFPEQYEARNPEGDTIGYVLVKNEWCEASCPDADGQRIYFSLTGQYGGFTGESEKMKHLDMIRLAIMSWYGWNASGLNGRH